MRQIQINTFGLHNRLGFGMARAEKHLNWSLLFFESEFLLSRVERENEKTKKSIDSASGLPRTIHLHGHLQSYVSHFVHSIKLHFRTTSIRGRRFRRHGTSGVASQSPHFKNKKWPRRRYTLLLLCILHFPSCALLVHACAQGKTLIWNVIIYK